MKELNEKEMKVLKLVSEGDSDAEICAKLKLKYSSERYIMNCMFRKLGAVNRINLIYIALQNGILE